MHPRITLDPSIATPLSPFATEGRHVATDRSVRVLGEG